MPRELRRAPDNRGRLYGEKLEYSWAGERGDGGRREHGERRSRSRTDLRPRHSRSRPGRAQRPAATQRTTNPARRRHSPSSSYSSPSPLRKSSPGPTVEVSPTDVPVSQPSPASDRSEDETAKVSTTISSDSGVESGTGEASSPDKVKTEYLEVADHNIYQIKQEPCLVKLERVDVVKQERVEVKQEAKPVRTIKQERNTDVVLPAPIKVEPRISYEQLLVPVRGGDLIPVVAGGGGAVGVPQITGAAAITATNPGVPQSAAGPPADMATLLPATQPNNTPPSTDFSSNISSNTQDPQPIPVVLASDSAPEPPNCFDQRRAAPGQSGNDNVVSDFFFDLPEDFFGKQKMRIPTPLPQSKRERVLVDTNPRVRATTKRKRKPHRPPVQLKKPLLSIPTGAAAGLSRAPPSLPATDRFLRGEDESNDLCMFSWNNFDKTATYLR